MRVDTHNHYCAVQYLTRTVSDYTRVSRSNAVIPLSLKRDARHACVQWDARFLSGVRPLWRGRADLRGAGRPAFYRQKRGCCKRNPFAAAPLKIHGGLYCAASPGALGYACFLMG